MEGTLGGLAASAFPELAIECRQIIFASESAALDALSRLADAGVEVLLLRERIVPAG